MHPGEGGSIPEDKTDVGLAYKGKLRTTPAVKPSDAFAFGRLNAVLAFHTT